MFNNKFISAVIVAAGSSTRMKSAVSKQLLKIGKKTVLEHTVSAFAQSDIVDEIIVVCPQADKESFEQLFSNNNFYNYSTPLKFTVGGSTRQQSVRNGVLLLSDDADYIAVHDGARPLIKTEHIKAVVSDAVEFGAATLAVPVKDTVKIAENLTVQSTPPRDKLYLIQTPQVFEKNNYTRAYEKAGSENLDFTDDCQLVELTGGKVHITIGDYTNIKITTAEDIAVAEAFLKMR